MTNSALSDFKFAGNPTTNAARLKAMAYGGPLVIAHDHWLSAMMPDALADAAEGGKTWRLGGRMRPNSCRGDPTWLPPDGTSIFDDGLGASLERTQAERMGLRALPWVA